MSFYNEPPPSRTASRIAGPAARNFCACACKACPRYSQNARHARNDLICRMAASSACMAALPSITGTSPPSSSSGSSSNKGIRQEQNRPHAQGSGIGPGRPFWEGVKSRIISVTTSATNFARWVHNLQRDKFVRRLCPHICGDAHVGDQRACLTGEVACSRFQLEELVFSVPVSLPRVCKSIVEPKPWRKGRFRSHTTMIIIWRSSAFSRMARKRANSPNRQQLKT